MQIPVLHYDSDITTKWYSTSYQITLGEGRNQGSKIVLRIVYKSPAKLLEDERTYISHVNWAIQPSDQSGWKISDIWVRPS